ncbi:MAG: helix-turn-helix domain-containing protein [Lachnospiraceae bacterium]
MTLGEKLSKLRRANNITQEQLASMFGVSRQAISKWESNVAYPEKDKLLKMSEVFKCSLDYLLKDCEDTQIPKDKALVVQGIDYSRFIGMWCNIDLKNWDSGYYTVAIIGQDNQYLYFYQADRNKSLKYGIVLKQHIDTVTSLDLGRKKQSSFPVLPDTMPSICDPFKPLLDKICTIQMHSPNFVTFVFSTDGYQKVIVSSITTDSIQIKDNNSVVIINKKDIVGIVES